MPANKLTPTINTGDVHNYDSESSTNSSPRTEIEEGTEEEQDLFNILGDYISDHDIKVSTAKMLLKICDTRFERKKTPVDATPKKKGLNAEFLPEQTQDKKPGKISRPKTAPPRRESFN